MKRKPFFCITATAILYALLLIGCDALDSAMDTMSKNVYEEVGFVSADTSSADEVAGKVNSLNVTKVYDLSDDAKVKDIATKYGYKDGDTKTEAVYTQLKAALTKAGLGSWHVLDPQPENDATALTESLSKALASESAKKELIAQLDKPAEGNHQKAAEDSLNLLDAVAKAVNTSEVWEAMGIADGSPIQSVVTTVLNSLAPGNGVITQGDVLVLQMTTDVISSAVSSYITQKSTGVETKTPVQIAETMLSGVQNVQNIAGELSGKTSGFFDFKIGDLLDKLDG
ncbi:MAG: hypothetical protein SPL79_07170 [Sphaerochaetaceae bacterium]|nr:hypothetical protein [Sphaerochaetaceae bacterium]